MSRGPTQLSVELEDEINRILIPKGFRTKFVWKGHRYQVYADIPGKVTGKRTIIVGRFKPHNLIRGLCNPEWMRAPFDDSVTCGWCRAFEPENPEIRLPEIRGPVPHLTSEDKRQLMLLRLSL